MKKLVLIIILLSLQVNSQNVSSNLDNTKLNFSFPTNPSVYEFSKYGNVPVNEYRGLAQVNIPLYEINYDGLNIPLTLNYFSGGIKVAEESGIVGLGWNLSLPTIVQNIKDEDDIKSFTKFQTLPGYTGGAIIPTQGGLNSQYWSSLFASSGFPLANPCSYGASVAYSNVPNYFVSSGNALINKNGNYPCNSEFYEMTFGNVDTEPDTFSVNINGDNLIIIRDDIGLNTPNPINNVVLPLKVINGHSEYKVELTNEGLKIVDYKGIQYYFGKIDEILYTTNNNGFLYSSNNGASSSNGVASKIHRLTKIITLKNEQINFTYSNNLVKDLTKDSYIYFKNISTTNPYNSVSGGIPVIENIEGVNKSTFNLNQDSLFSVSSNSQTQNYSFLSSIVTPFEQITLSYSDRIDYEGMKKLDNIIIKNIKNEVVKNIIFGYDYFGSGDGFLNKRLKLNSVTINSDNPYLFEYNSTELPSKKSFSIDYWGFYNGKPNTSFFPNLSDLGYPQYSDNSQNDFKSYLSFCRAATLEKIIYPTGGFSEFEYELHSFDDLILHSNMNSYTPLITQGAGLRIKSIKNYSNMNSLSTKTNYEYFNGKVIFKKRLARNISDVKSVEFYMVGPYEEVNYYYTSLIEASLNNGNLGNIFLDDIDDYVGYDKVITQEAGSIDKGRVEKEFENNPYSLIFPLQKLNFRPSYYRNRNYVPNGTLKKERIYDNSNQLKIEQQYTYTTLTSNIQRYGVSFSSYDTSFSFSSNSFGSGSGATYYIYPRFLITSYPIFVNSARLANQKVIEYFQSGSKLATTEYQFDVNNIPIGKKIKNQTGQYFYEENSQMASTPDLINKNILNLPSFTDIKENGTTKKYYQYLYSTLNNVILPVKTEELPEGNTDPTKKINVFYDLYDDKSNLIQYHKENDIYTCVIWGYNKTLPVAKIENVQYSTISSGLILDIQSKSDTGTEAQLLTALDNLRNSLPNAFITTYTHKPLIGVSSITDSKGDRVTYHYDSNNRLQFVKDKSGNIISENEYYFRPQN